MRQTHFVVLFNRSILANSFGEWILANMYVLPIEIQGEPRIFIKECIGPVHAFETLIMDFPYDSSAACFTCFTNGCKGFVRAAASP